VLNERNDQTNNIPSKGRSHEPRTTDPVDRGPQAEQHEQSEKRLRPLFRECKLSPTANQVGPLNEESCPLLCLTSADKSVERSKPPNEEKVLIMNREQLIQSIVARKLSTNATKVFCVCIPANRQPAAKTAR
jgi:hypothetical protein